MIQLQHERLLPLHLMRLTLGLWAVIKRSQALLKLVHLTWCFAAFCCISIRLLWSAVHPTHTNNLHWDFKGDNECDDGNDEAEEHSQRSAMMTSSEETGGTQKRMCWSITVEKLFSEVVIYVITAETIKILNLEMMMNTKGGKTQNHDLDWWWQEDKSRNTRLEPKWCFQTWWSDTNQDIFHFVLTFIKQAALCCCHFSQDTIPNARSRHNVFSSCSGGSCEWEDEDEEDQVPDYSITFLTPSNLSFVASIHLTVINIFFISAKGRNKEKTVLYYFEELITVEQTVCLSQGLGGIIFHQYYISERSLFLFRGYWAGKGGMKNERWPFTD